MDKKPYITRLPERGKIYFNSLALNVLGWPKRVTYTTDAWGFRVQASPSGYKVNSSRCISCAPLWDHWRTTELFRKMPTFLFQVKDQSPALRVYLQ